MTMDVFDFFCGCGGTSSGLRSAGCSIKFGIDFDLHAIKSYQLNFPEAVIMHQDIRNINPDAINFLMKKNSRKIFCGCAPCQPFSNQTHSEKKLLDPRTDLLLEFARFVSYWHPDYVMVENVPGLQNRISQFGPLGRFKKILHDQGYYIDEGVKSCRDYGVPQRRDRFILIASVRPDISLPKSTHGNQPRLEKPTTVRDWIYGLPEIGAGETDKDDPQHAAAKLSSLNLERIRSTLEGGGRETWPRELQLKCHVGHEGHTDVYGRLAWDRPAASLTTRCISYSNGRFGHPDQARAISVREAACLQTFDRTYKFFGNLEAKGRQIGNAVPPLMARAIGQQILEHANLHSRRAEGDHR